MTHVELSGQGLQSQPGWYRGDFHAHTNCSDGVHPPSELIALAKTEGLDFIAITDHNTVDAFSDLPSDPGILLLRGIEITLRDGDWNVFGVDRWFDWMDQICVTKSRISRLEGRYRTTTDLMRQISAQGLVNSMNHPLLKPWEWRDGATALGYLNCLEVWNDPSWPDNSRANPRAVALWSDWLNAGYRITAIGGSDYHRPIPKSGDMKPAERLGVPSTYVLAEELSSPAILDALRRRRAYVSMGPLVSLEAWADSARCGMGDALEGLSDTIEFTASVRNAPGSARAQIVRNGQVVFDHPVGGRMPMQYCDRVEVVDTRWYRLDVRDTNGGVLAITNPIFAGPVRTPRLQTFGEFARGFRS